MSTRYKYKQIKQLVRPITVGLDWLVRPYYSIRLLSSSSNEKFGIQTAEYDVKLDVSSVPFSKVLKVLKFVFKEIIFIIVYNEVAKPKQLGTFRLVISADSLKSPINFTHYSIFSKETVNVLLDEISKTTQSNESLFLDKSIKISFLVYNPVPRR